MSIHKSEDGKSWEVRARYKDGFGKVHQYHKRGIKTKNEAKKLEAEFLARRDGNEIESVSNMTLSKAMHEYLDFQRHALKNRHTRTDAHTLPV